MCNDHGGIVDDLTLYRLADDHFMLTVNASNIDKDWAWVTAGGRGGAWTNVSEATGLLAGAAGLQILTTLAWVPMTFLMRAGLGVESYVKAQSVASMVLALMRTTGGALGG
jgi:aminomethyltransferase